MGKSHFSFLRFYIFVEIASEIFDPYVYLSSIVRIKGVRTLQGFLPDSVKMTRKISSIQKIVLFHYLSPVKRICVFEYASWQTLTAHAQPFRGARDLAFCLKVPLDSLLVCASSEGSGETARMRRLAWTFAARIGDKYKIRLTRSIW